MILSVRRSSRLKPAVTCLRSCYTCVSHVSLATFSSGFFLMFNSRRIANSAGAGVDLLAIQWLVNPYAAVPASKP